MANVKPGDKALVVNCVHPRTAWTLGLTVTIERRCNCVTEIRPGALWWTFEEPLRQGILAMQCAPDWCLRRIDPLAERATRTAPRREEVTTQ